MQVFDVRVLAPVHSQRMPPWDVLLKRIAGRQVEGQCLHISFEGCCGHP